MNSHKSRREPWSKHRNSKPLKIQVETEHEDTNEWCEASGEDFSGNKGKSEDALKNLRKFNRKKESGGLVPKTNLMHFSGESGGCTFGMGTVSPESREGLQWLLKQKRMTQQEPRESQRNNCGPCDNRMSMGDGVFVIQMPEIPEIRQKPDIHIPRYVHACLDLMYCTCTSPYDRKLKEKEDQTSCEYSLSVIQKVLFWYFALFSSLQSFDFTKYAVLIFLENRAYGNLIDIGFHAVVWAMKIYATYFLAFRQHKITEMLNSWENYEKYVQNGETNISENSKEFAVGVMYWPLAITSMIIIPLLKTIVHQGIFDWSLKSLILGNSEEVAEMLFAWKPEHVNGTATELTEKFGSTLTQATMIMGAFGILMRTCHNMQVDAILDLLMHATIVTDKQLTVFGEKLQKKEAEEGIALMKEDDSCWEHYRIVRPLNKKSNATFDGLLKIATLHNCFAFSFIIGFTFQRTEDHAHTMFYAYKFVKLVFTYFKGRRSARHNEVIEEWLKSLPCDTKRFRVGIVHYTRCVMLHELKQHPLGFGKDMFFISDEFLFMFFGFIGSLIGFFVNFE